MTSARAPLTPVTPFSAIVMDTAIVKSSRIFPLVLTDNSIHRSPGEEACSQRGPDQYPNPTQLHHSSAKNDTVGSEDGII